MYVSANTKAVSLNLHRYIEGAPGNRAPHIHGGLPGAVGGLYKLNAS
jgi:hypothetical protein